MAFSVYGPGTPYITPATLQNAPTGITWKTIPNPRSTEQEQVAEQLNICARATSMVDTACNQVIRATIDTEQVYGPDYYVTVQNSTGMARVVLQRWPVVQILGGATCPAAQFPRSLQPIAANQFAIERPIIGMYGTSTPADSGEGGQAVLVAPGYVNWFFGPRGCLLEITYINGWPHTSLTASTTAGDSTIDVDDCTGWAPVTAGGQGATGLLKDSGNQEMVSVTATTVTSGPGTMTLANPLQFTHGPGVACTTLPEQLQQATIMFAASQALVRGATATTIQNVAGTGQATASGADELAVQAELLCVPYRRVW